MSKIREAYLQRCEIGLLACERNEGLRLCRENDIVRYELYREGDSVAAARILTARETRLPFDIYNPREHSPSPGCRCGVPVKRWLNNRGQRNEFQVRFI